MENIMKLSTSIKQIKKVAKSLIINTSRLEIEAKKEDCTITNTKGIIPLLRLFIYMRRFSSS